MKKKIKILVIISVILIILGPVLGLLLNKVILVNQPVVIPATSDDDIQDAYAYEFSLVKGQKLVFEFSVYTANITATLKILGKGTYDEEYEASSDPGTISGKSFVVSQFAFGQSPSGQSFPATSISIVNDGFYYIEFAGATTGDYLISIPGAYVVIVYGTNDGIGTNVDFNAFIKIDGPGELVGILLLLVGLGGLVAIMIIGTMGYIKKTGRGLL